MDAENTRMIRPIHATRKHEAVVRSLRQLAKSLGPGARLPRVRQMAADLGIAVATLDQALRVLEESGVLLRRQRSGIFVAEPRPRTVGVVFGSDVFQQTSTSFPSLLLQHCQRRASSHGERFSYFVNMTTSVEPVAHDLAEAVSRKALDGVLAVSPHRDLEAWLRGQNLPAVVLGPDQEEWEHRVVLDGGHLTRIAAEELRARGCRSLGVLAPIRRHVDLFREALSQTGLVSRESWILVGDETTTNHEETGVACATRFLSRNGVLAEGSGAGNLPDGLIVTDEIMARGVCATLSRFGMVPGRHLQIASHSNRGSWALAEWESGLILCQYDPEEIADAMFRVLETLMEGRQPPTGTIRVPAHIRKFSGQKGQKEKTQHMTTQLQP